MEDNSVIEESDRLSYCSNTSSSSFHLNYSVNSFTENENLGIVQRRRRQFEEMSKQLNNKADLECEECCKGVLKKDGTWIKENIEEEGSVSEISDINDDDDVNDHQMMNEMETKKFFYAKENEIEIDERAISFYKNVDKKIDNKTTSDIKFNRNSGLSSNESEEYFR